jgi:hypothetical protein
VILVLSLFFHPTIDLDEWAEDWQDRVVENGGSLSFSLVGEYVEMAQRHPCYFRNDCPRPVRRSSSSTGSTSMGSNVEQWRYLVAAYFPADQVNLALRVMVCESGGNPTAKNPGSSASGLFQHLGKYWTKRSAAAGFAGASIFDPTANVAVAAWLAAQGWSHWNASRACWG